LEFILPDAEAFGRDKTVPMPEATRAKVDNSALPWGS
jgi:hypothetical protein